MTSRPGAEEVAKRQAHAPADADVAFDLLLLTYNPNLDVRKIAQV